MLCPNTLPSQMLTIARLQVNRMCDSLTNQVRSIAEVTTAVANGNLSQKVEIEAEGEIAALKETINSMVDQLSRFASEVTRVTLEVGSEGKLGGQVQVDGVSGEWKRLTDNVSSSRSCTAVRRSRVIGQPDVSEPYEPGPIHRRCHYCRRPRQPRPDRSNRR